MRITAKADYAVRAAVELAAAAALPEVWVALRASLRDVLEHVSLADIASGSLPKKVTDRTRVDDAWQPH